MMQSVALQRCVLERSILLGKMINVYTKYSKVINFTHNLICSSSVIVATAAKLAQFESVSTIILVLTILTLCVTKARDLLKFDHIVRICKEQIIKYKKLYDQIENSSKPNDTVETYKTTYELIFNFDPPIDEKILESFKKECEQTGIQASFDEMAQLKAITLRPKEESKMTLAEIEQKINEEKQLSPRTRQQLTEHEIREFRNSLDLRVNTAKLKKLSDIKFGSF